MNRRTFLRRMVPTAGLLAIAPAALLREVARPRPRLWEQADPLAVRGLFDRRAGRLISSHTFPFPNELHNGDTLTINWRVRFAEV